jgi:hypothetical protein
MAAEMILGALLQLGILLQAHLNLLGISPSQIHQILGRTPGPIKLRHLLTTILRLRRLTPMAICRNRRYHLQTVAKIDARDLLEQ